MILIYKQKFPKIQTIKTYFKDIPYSYYENYINDCYKLKKYRRKKINNKIPYFSICLATYNMENYIESTILSIMNQSFQDFEIIIVNDFSNDKTLNIINKIKNKKIKVINHSQNLGVLTSRIDCILNSSGKYLILMDPDDLILEPNLFEYLYNYNLRYNLDIIEFTMLSYLEKTKYLHKEEFYYHYHNFSENIIYQPQLSNLFFYIPNTKKYTDIVCQSSRNKIFRKELLLKTVNYLGNDYYKEFFITAEDTLISLISYQFANNYSNINYTGYMYNIREKSMTHGEKTIQQKILYDYNYLLFNKILYKLIKDFNKDVNLMFYDLKKRTNFLLLQLKKLSTKLKPEVNEFYKEIRNNTNISKEFNNFIYNSLIK
jgi:glycosyltransferase involved in cell wall biosynthesis